MEGGRDGGGVEGGRDGWREGGRGRGGGRDVYMCVCRHLEVDVGVGVHVDQML